MLFWGGKKTCGSAGSPARRQLTRGCPLLWQAITEDKYEIIQAVGDAAIIIKNTKEPPLTLTIHLTSPVVREELEKQLAGGNGSRRQAGRRPVERLLRRWGPNTALPAEIQKISRPRDSRT